MYRVCGAWDALDSVAISKRAFYEYSLFVSRSRSNPHIVLALYPEKVREHLRIFLSCLDCLIRFMMRVVKTYSFVNVGI